MFRSKMLNRIQHAELCMQHNGGDASVCVSPMVKAWRHWRFPGLRNLLCDFISLWFLVVELMGPLCACHDVMRFCGATWIPAFWEAFEYWNTPDSMSSYDLENGNTQHIRKIRGGRKTKGSQFLPMVPHPCAFMHRTQKETPREVQTMLLGHESTF